MQAAIPLFGFVNPVNLNIAQTQQTLQRLTLYPEKEHGYKKGYIWINPARRGQTTITDSSETIPDPWQSFFCDNYCIGLRISLFPV